MAKKSKSSKHAGTTHATSKQATANDAAVPIEDAIEPGHEVHATHLVVSCIDHRCTDDLQSVMARIVAPENDDPFAWDRWDHIALPGASLGVVQNAFPSWREAFTIQLGIALDLHPHIETIVVVDHLECGAYKRMLPGYDEDQTGAHERTTDAFRSLVNALHARIRVERWLLEPCPKKRGGRKNLDWQARSLDDPELVHACEKH